MYGITKEVQRQKFWRFYSFINIFPTYHRILADKKLPLRYLLFVITPYKEKEFSFPHYFLDVNIRVSHTGTNSKQVNRLHWTVSIGHHRLTMKCKSKFGILPVKSQCCVHKYANDMNVTLVGDLWITIAAANADNTT